MIWVTVGLTLTSCLFCVNALHHIENDQHLPLTYRPEIFQRRFNSKGYAYTLSSSSFCGRTAPPCINSYSVGDPDALVTRFYEQNKMY